jgi:ATP-dependent DNA helicase RecG
MIIEQAERFGLAQLHQLRGRIGRGSEKSTCLLMYNYPLSEVAKKRLEVMRQTDDGFIIAEEDLKLRGAGEILGTKQSGLENLRLSDFELQSELIATARKDALQIVQTDPMLQTPRGQELKILMYLFEKDVYIHTISAG